MRAADTPDEVLDVVAHMNTPKESCFGGWIYNAHGTAMLDGTHVTRHFVHTTTGVNNMPTEQRTLLTSRSYGG